MEPVGWTGRNGRSTVPLGFKTRPDYQFLGQAITFIPDAVYPWTTWLSQIRNIRREFDPGFVPIFRRKRYRAPGGSILEFVHHGVARYDPTVVGEQSVINALRPTGAWWREFEPVGQQINLIELWFEGPRTPGRTAKRVPRPFVPWGTWVYAWARAIYSEMEFDKRAKEAQEHDEAARAHAAMIEADKEAAYAAKHDWKHLKYNYDESQTPDDEKYLLARQRGQIPYEPKPFADAPGKDTALDWLDQKETA